VVIKIRVIILTYFKNHNFSISLLNFQNGQQEIGNQNKPRFQNHAKQAPEQQKAEIQTIELVSMLQINRVKLEIWQQTYDESGRSPPSMLRPDCQATLAVDGAVDGFFGHQKWGVNIDNGRRRCHFSLLASAMC